MQLEDNSVVTGSQRDSPLRSFVGMRGLLLIVSMFNTSKVRYDKRLERKVVKFKARVRAHLLIASSEETRFYNDEE